tara:strand:- start:1576 stop:1926 length:351 start_codon:yes stop_codon:yes gene_type:complete
MTNPLKGQVEVKLGDKTYNARLTIESIIGIEETLNIGLLKLAQQMSTGDVRIGQVVGVLLPALRGGGNDLQHSDVIKLVQDAGIVASTTVVANLIAQSLQAETKPEDGKTSKKSDK